MTAQSSDILPIAARKEEVVNLLDRLELIMVTVGTKAPIFSEFLGPARKFSVSLTRRI
jgi:hypothetical protein